PKGSLRRGCRAARAFRVARSVPAVWAFVLASKGLWAPVGPKGSLRRGCRAARAFRVARSVPAFRVASSVPVAWAFALAPEGALGPHGAEGGAFGADVERRVRSA